MTGAELYKGEVKHTEWLNNENKVYKQTYGAHAVLIKDGKVYDKMGGFNGVPYKEWATKVGVGKAGFNGSTFNRLRRITLAVAKSQADR